MEKFLKIVNKKTGKFMLQIHIQWTDLNGIQCLNFRREWSPFYNILNMPLLNCWRHRPYCASSHRRKFVCDSGDISPPLLKVVVTVTTTFSTCNLKFSSLTEQVLWLSVSVSCIMYSKRCKFRPKMRLVAGLCPDPLGELQRSPSPLAAIGGAYF